MLCPPGPLGWRSHLTDTLGKALPARLWVAPLQYVWKARGGHLAVCCLERRGRTNGGKIIGRQIAGPQRKV